MKYRSIVCTIVLVMVLSLTIGFSAFVSEMSISHIVADVRVEKDVRITDIAISGGKIQNVDNIFTLNFDDDSILFDNLFGSLDGYVEFSVTITNIGSAEVGILNVDLPDGVGYEFNNYILEDMLCDDEGKCNLGASRKLELVVFPTSEVGLNREDVRIDFDFREFHKVAYFGLDEQNGYPTEVIDGGIIDFIMKESPIMLGVRDEFGSVEYSFSNKNLIIRDVTSDIEIEAAYESEWRYDYKNVEQVFIVPVTGTYRFQLWGASGGGTSTVRSGKGAYTSGFIHLKRDDKLYIHTGQSGSDDSTSTYNVGGITEYVNWGSGVNQKGYFYAGGGATDIRLVSGNWNDFNSLKSRIMVAAGGGGTLTYFGSLATTGDAGGLYGYDGTINSGTVGRVSTGGKQNMGGENGIIGTGLSGFGKVTFGGGTYVQVAGGGGGYYTGGNGAHGNSTVGGGAGGSSFISGHDGCDAIAKSSTEGQIIHTGQSVHYSNYKFYDTWMVDGRGYQWTNVLGEMIGMPTHHGGSSMQYNEGAGYAKVNLYSVD